MTHTTNEPHTTPVLVARVIDTCRNRPGARVRTVLIPAMELCPVEHERVMKGLPLGGPNG